MPSISFFRARPDTLGALPVDVPFAVWATLFSRLFEARGCDDNDIGAAFASTMPVGYLVSLQVVVVVCCAVLVVIVSKVKQERR